MRFAECVSRRLSVLEFEPQNFVGAGSRTNWAKLSFEDKCVTKCNLVTREHRASKEFRESNPVVANGFCRTSEPCVLSHGKLIGRARLLVDVTESRRVVAGKELRRD
jgi:hypothetical protein